MSNRAVDLDNIWRRLHACEGAMFETKTGRPFTYEIEGNIFRPSRTERSIHSSNFGKILHLLPISGPGEIANRVQGSAYVWAVLHDRRVRMNDW